MPLPHNGGNAHGSGLVVQFTVNAFRIRAGIAVGPVTEPGEGVARHPTYR